MELVMPLFSAIVSVVFLAFFVLLIVSAISAFIGRRRIKIFSFVGCIAIVVLLTTLSFQVASIKVIYGQNGNMQFMSNTTKNDQEQNVYLNYPFISPENVGKYIQELKALEAKQPDSSAKYLTFDKTGPLNGLLWGIEYFKETVTSPEYVYIGDTKDSRPNGFGILYSYDSKYEPMVPLYIGNFKNGSKDGYGIELNYIRGYSLAFIEYEGYYSKNKYDGKGFKLNEFKVDDIKKGLDADELKLLEESSDLFKSRIQSMDKFEFLFPDFCPVSYVGYSVSDYKNGKQDGKGKVYARTGSIIYDGGLKDGIYHGKGKFYYETGELAYEGNFKDGKYDGKGKSYFKSGDIKYDGEFKKGLYHGNGTLYNSDGSVRNKAVWENGDIK